MSASARAASDRNLLFGILALQMDFINRDALIRAMNAWVLEKSKPLGQVLVEQGAMAADARALLEPLVQKHLQMHGDDPAKSLASVGSAGSARRELERIADGDVQASLAHLPAGGAGGADSWATRAPSVGTPTASGLRFRVLRAHAKGGLGQVSVALDAELHREVALKEIQDRHADHPDSRARFLLEAEVTGGLEHPGIVPVYGLGAYPDGRPYYAMRFIKGDSLQEAIARFHKAESAKRDPQERALALRQLLGRFIDVCDAIAYAHSRGVLHRDLKPGNVMLGPYGETLVVDWGLAKPMGTRTADGNETAAEQPLQPALSGSGTPTLAGSAVGTPAYMPPEQAAGRLDELGPASDVYSLGATLYCLLTGKAPFEGDVGEILRRVQRGDFPRPREVGREAPAALEAVCLKAMALRPADRYPGPRALAADVERWLADEPVSAWREPGWVRAGRWARRHRALVTSAAAAMLALLLSAIPAFVLIANSRDAALQSEQKALELAGEKSKLADEKGRLAVANEELAEKRKQALEAEGRQRAKVERLLYTSQITLAHRKWQDGEVEYARELLASCRWDFRNWEHAYLHHLFNETVRTFGGLGGKVHGMCFSPDGKRLAGAGNDVVRVWDVATGRESRSLKGHSGAVSSVCFSPDGKRLATAGTDGTVRLWDAASGEEIRALKLEGSVKSGIRLSFSPDGERLAAARPASKSEGTVRVWEAATGREIFSLKGHADSGVCFGPDGKRLAATDRDGTVRVREAATGEEVVALRGPEGEVGLHVCFSLDGKRLATAGQNGNVRVWDAATGQESVVASTSLRGAASSVCFSPDGKWLAGTAGFEVRVWETATGEEIFAPKGLNRDANQAIFGDLGERTGRNLRNVCFSPDSESLAWADGGTAVGIRRLVADEKVLALKGHTAPVVGVCFSPDGKRLAAAGRDGMLRVWDTTVGQENLFLMGGVRVCFSPDGKRLAGVEDDHVNLTVCIWDAATGEKVRAFRGHPDSVQSVCFSPDGKRLAATEDDVIRIWDADTGREVRAIRTRTLSVRSVCFSPDGNWLVSAGLGEELDKPGEVKLWDAATGRGVRAFQGHTGAVSRVCFSPDGKRLAGAGDGVSVWDVSTGERLRTLRGHAGSVLGVCFSPDGKRLASAGEDKTVRLWDTAAGQEILTLKGHTGIVSGVCFSPDSKRLASTGGADGTVRVWDEATGQEVLTFKVDFDASRLGIGDAPGDELPVGDVCFSPDGRRLAGTGAYGPLDRAVYVWDTAIGEDVLVLAGNPSEVSGVAFSKDGKRIVAQGQGPRIPLPADEEVVRAWDAVTGIEIVPCVDPPPPAGQRRAVSPDGSLVVLILGDETTAPFGTVEVRRRSPFTVAPALRQQEEEARALAWHRQKAREAEWSAEQLGGPKWLAAAFHLGQLLRLGPERAGLYARRGRASVRLELLAQARRDFTHAVQLAAKGPAPLQAADPSFQQTLLLRPVELPVYKDLLLALAHHHLGQDGEARRRLARGEVWMERNRETVPTLMQMNEDDRADLLRLHEEVRALLHPAQP